MTWFETMKKMVSADTFEYPVWFMCLVALCGWSITKWMVVLLPPGPVWQYMPLPAEGWWTLAGQIDYSQACEFLISTTFRNSHGLEVWNVLRFVSVQDIVTTKCMWFVILLVIILIGVVIKRKRGQRNSVHVSIILTYGPSPVINLLIPDVMVEI